MVYLLKMVIFHGYVSHNQRVIEYAWRSPLWYLHLDDLDEWNIHEYTGCYMELTLN